VIACPLQEAIVLGRLVDYLADVFLYQVSFAYPVDGDETPTLAMLPRGPIFVIG
jgi:hypothetical protein